MVEKLSAGPVQGWPVQLKRGISILGYKLGMDYDEKRMSIRRSMKMSRKTKPPPAKPYVDNSQADVIEAVIAAYAQASADGKAALPASKDTIQSDSSSDDDDDDDEMLVTVKTPLGISFDGNAAHGMFVTKVKDGGNGAKTGEMDVGMRILSVNGKECAGLEKKDVVAIVKGQKDRCEMLLLIDIDSYRRFRHKLPALEPAARDKKKKKTKTKAAAPAAKKPEPKPAKAAKKAELDVYGKPMKPGHDKFGNPLPKDAAGGGGGKEDRDRKADGGKGGAKAQATTVEEASLHAEMLLKAAEGRKHRVKGSGSSNGVVAPIVPTPKKGLHGLPPGWRMAQDVQGRVSCVRCLAAGLGWTVADNGCATVPVRDRAGAPVKIPPVSNITLTAMCGLSASQTYYLDDVHLTTTYHDPRKQVQVRAPCEATPLMFVADGALGQWHSVRVHVLVRACWQQSWCWCW